VDEIPAASRPTLQSAYRHVAATTVLAECRDLRPRFLGVKSHMKGGEIGLPKYDHFHVAKCIERLYNRLKKKMESRILSKKHS
jgi:hypothetical protein